jgi:hypothetical protein
MRRASHYCDSGMSTLALLEPCYGMGSFLLKKMRHGWLPDLVIMTGPSHHASNSERVVHRLVPEDMLQGKLSGVSKVAYLEWECPC